ncbi:hypothetical protein GKZ90_0012345 [Flavobacterium sp. MC2016-06]|jgi:hypothetical protein|uniref:hypothetical protein n=1 Tax=Flavobacterium sp. MC2016-06 TaxID=2676308 RepID=UPI0012BA63B5|nr:hypothetical protein [Flavobacterium sp. MC2016-06]MBU3862408.1 hypothetical protein [Flavobacterium sp. MC2016-06]
MKKIILLLLFIIPFTGFSQIIPQEYTIKKPLRLQTVELGSKTDSILVRGSNEVIKYIPRSEFSSGGESVTLENLLNTDGIVTGNQLFRMEANDHFNSSTINNREIASNSSSGKVYLRNNALSFSVGGKCMQLSMSTNQTISSQSFVTMPDENGQLALKTDFAYDIPATYPQSAVDLSSDFQNKPNGFRIHCNLMAGGPVIYEKTETGWIMYPVTVIVP